MEVKLEVCAGCMESVWAAARGGAYRVELCSGLGEGGVTPSLGFVKEALKVPGLKKNILIRPRGGDFLYTPAEVEIMVQDILAVKDLGADGVVIGALCPDGTIDEEAMEKMLEAACGMEVTFHRAFDMSRDADESLERIIALGCDRILTSGMAPAAEVGIPTLRRMVERALGRISVMPGCGVKSANAAIIVKETGVGEIHASARCLQDSKMQFRQEGVCMGQKGDEYKRMATSEKEVFDIVCALSGENVL